MQSCRWTAPATVTQKMVIVTVGEMGRDTELQWQAQRGTDAKSSVGFCWGK